MGESPVSEGSKLVCPGPGDLPLSTDRFRAQTL